jgi:lipoprotein signal peptidase
MEMIGQEQQSAITRGRFLFMALIVIIGCTALWFILTTEEAGIEERFASALGGSHEEGGHEHEEGAAFSLEGSPVLYAVVLAVICGLCWVLYRKFGA